MLHIASFEWKGTLATGQFQCPRCQSLQLYRHRSARQFLTINFIPLIPISGVTYFVECRKCKLRSAPEILNPIHQNQTNGETREIFSTSGSFAQELAYTIATVIADDGVVEESEIISALAVYPRLCGETITRQQLGEFCRQMIKEQIPSRKWVANYASRWSMEQRVLVLQAIFAVASSTGKISARRNQTLLLCRSLFELSDQEFENAIEHTLEWI